MIVIGNGFDLGNGVSGSSLYKCQGWPQCYDLDLLMACYLDLRSDTKHCFPNNKWQMYTEGLLA